MAASLVPSPTVNVRPVVCASVKRPIGDRHRDLHGTGGRIHIRHADPGDRQQRVFIDRLGAGTVSTGASLTAATVTSTEAVLE